MLAQNLSGCAVNKKNQVIPVRKHSFRQVLLEIIQIFSNPITFELDRSVKMALMIKKFWIFLFTYGISQAYRMNSDEGRELKKVRHWW